MNKRLTLIRAEQAILVGRTLNRGFVMTVNTAGLGIAAEPTIPYGFIAHDGDMWNITYNSPEGTDSVTVEGDENLGNLLHLAPNRCILLVIPPTIIDRITNAAWDHGIEAFPFFYDRTLLSAYGLTR